MELWKAAYNHNLEEVRKLLQDESVNVNFRKENFYANWTPLHYSCIYGYTKIVLLFLEHKNINVNLVDMNGYTPFSLACLNGQTEIVKILLPDIRVDVNLADNYTLTPLMWSCYFEQTIQELLKCARVDLFAKTTKDYIWTSPHINSGSTALDFAKHEGEADIFNILEEEMNRRKQGTI